VKKQEIEQIPTVEGGARRRLSRRAFLRLAGGLSLAGAGELLGACRLPGALSEPTAEATPWPTVWSPTATVLPSPVPTLTPTASPAPTATATPIAITNLFDENSLATVYVAQASDGQGYPAAPPYDPDTVYPEYPYPGEAPGTDNGCYRLVREAMRLFSPQGYGQPGWNPLAGVIRPGDRVLIKPNLVDDSAWQQGQITHPAFLRPIIDYAAKACGPTGQVILGEGPWAAGVFDRVVENTGIRAMVEHLGQVHGVPVVMHDLNKAERETTPLVDLGTASALTLADRTWLDGHYQPMKRGGDPGVGAYRIAPTVLQADVVISAPKIKVHCSGGITVAMKNMLGIIPAWDGPYEKAQLKDCAHASDVDMAQGNLGKYLNNDTIWRSMADLNRILLYADGAGRLQLTRQRRYLAIVDGIVGAEESQYKPHPRPLGTVIVSTDPVTCDAVAARVMGFDPRKLRSVILPEQIASHSLGPWRPAAVRVVTSWGGGLNTVYRASLTPELRVYSWAGQVEANDFDPPQVKAVGWDEQTGDLSVRIVDPTGVAYARLAYSYQEQRLVHDLVLTGGDVLNGEWRIPLPAGLVVKNGELLVGDSLFNQDAMTITW